MKNKLSEEIVQEILTTKSSGVLKKPESSTIEYKSLFNWKDKKSRAKYLRTFAAYANRKGGYLIFGIKNKPRKIIGIESNSFDIDDADISSFINTYLAPSVEYERDEFEIDGYTIGVIYVYESNNKPVVCIKDYDDIISESSIYFRYYSKNDRIKSSDLICLLNMVREKESQKWLDLFSKVSKVGIENIGTFNFKSGEIETSIGNRFIIDENLLRRIKVLDKYSENITGAPAVRIIGDIDKHGTIVTKSRYLNDFEIISDFLEHKTVDDPQEYIKAFPYQSSWYLPVYFYINQAGLTINETIQLLNNVKRNSQTKTNLIKRLNDDSRLLQLKSSSSIEANTAIGQKRKGFYDRVVNGRTIQVNTEGEAKRLLEAILNLPKDQFALSNVQPILLDIHNKYYSNSDVASKIRRSVSYIDLLFFREVEK